MGTCEWADEFPQVIFHGYLENRAVEEQSEQLNEVKDDVAVFLLHPDNVGQGEGPHCVDASVGRGGPGEETKLEKVLHHNSQLRETEKKVLDHVSAEKKLYTTFFHICSGTPQDL